MRRSLRLFLERFHLLLIASFLSSTLHLHRLLSLALIGRRLSHSSEAIEVRLSLLFHRDNRTNRIPAPGNRHTAVIASHLVKRLLQGEAGDPPLR